MRSARARNGKPIASSPLSRLRDAGCTIAGTETVLFEWTGGGDDAAFRDVLKIVKGLPGVARR